MKIFILLFFIFISVITSKIELCIDKFLYQNRKIKFSIKIKIYILRKLKIFEKKIKKKHIMKIINISERKTIFKAEKKILDIEIEKIDLKIKYGIKHIFTNIYVYGLVNTIIPMLISKYTNKNTEKNIKIETDFYNNSLYLEMILKLKIDILNSVINYFKHMQKAILKNVKL